MRMHFPLNYSNCLWRVRYSDYYLYVGASLKLYFLHLIVSMVY